MYPSRDLPEHYKHPSGIEPSWITRHLPHGPASALECVLRSGKKDGVPADIDLDKALHWLEMYQQRAEKTKSEIMELVNKVAAVETEARAQAITAIAKLGLFADSTADAYEVARKAVYSLMNRL